MKRRNKHNVIQQLYSLLTKIAVVLLTSGTVFDAALTAFIAPDDWVHVILSISCVVLVEGFLLVLWFAIDTDHEAPLALKITRAFLLVGLCVLLIQLPALSFNGQTPWITQIFIGASVAASIVDMLWHHWQIRSVSNDGHRIRRIRRRHAKDKAIRQLIAAYTKANQRLEARYKLERARLEANHKMALQEVAHYRNLLLEKAYAKDNLARGQMLARMARQEQSILPQPEPRQEGEFI